MTINCTTSTPRSMISHCCYYLSWWSSLFPSMISARPILLQLKRCTWCCLCCRYAIIPWRPSRLSSYPFMMACIRSKDWPLISHFLIKFSPPCSTVQLDSLNYTSRKILSVLILTLLMIFGWLSMCKWSWRQGKDWVLLAKKDKAAVALSICLWVPWRRSKEMPF